MTARVGCMRGLSVLAVLLLTAVPHGWNSALAQGPLDDCPPSELVDYVLGFGSCFAWGDFEVTHYDIDRYERGEACLRFGQEDRVRLTLVNPEPGDRVLFTVEPFFGVAGTGEATFDHPVVEATDYQVFGCFPSVTVVGAEVASVLAYRLEWLLS